MKSAFKICIILLIIPQFVFANDKIAFLDIDYILSNSNQGKILIKELDKINKDNILLLQNKEKELKKLETEIENKKNILSKTELNNKIKVLQDKILKFRNEKNQLTNEFNKFKKKEIASLLQLINPLISNYVEEKSINIVLDKKNILIGKNSYDITQDILEIVNSNIK